MRDYLLPIALLVVLFVGYGLAFRAVRGAGGCAGCNSCADKSQCKESE